jgi:hypothetical protein
MVEARPSWLRNRSDGNFAWFHRAGKTDIELMMVPINGQEETSALPLVDVRKTCCPYGRRILPVRLQSVL